ncbi:MAG: sensor histidine kinase [Hyphomonas sp.]
MRNEWENLLRALPLPAFEVDVGGHIVAFNNHADVILKLEGLDTPHASDVITSVELLAAVEAVGKNTAEEPISVDVDFAPGETWRVHISRPEGADHILVVMEDLSPVRRAARSRSDFIANVSHELRTPLTAVSGFIETMRGPAKDDKESWGRFLDIMARESERMSRLVSDLLSLSAIEFSENVEPTDESDLVSIAKEALLALQALAEDKGVTLELQKESEKLPIIGYQDEMMQVVENLVSNAVKYTPDGGVITVRIGEARSLVKARLAAAEAWPGCERMTLLQAMGRPGVEDASVWLRVEDQGLGIEKEHLPRLGERFYRADKSRGGKITGTGLGLAIVKHIMAHHRGGMAVESEPGRGSAFAIWLPKAPPEI